jgi:peptidoglycan glycosyltransferase
LMAALCALPPLLGGSSASAQETQAPLDPFSVSDAPVPLVSLTAMTRRQDQYLVPLEGGGEAVLTLQPRLQEAAEEVLAAYDLPFGAAVVLSVPDGRVLALAGRSTVDPTLGPAELALRPWAPAASVFKLVSAAALVSEAGLTATSRVCYHGGVSSIVADNLIDLPKIDRCDTLGFGLGKSQNAILAKLASQHLTPESLGRVATSFGFGAPIPFAVEVGASDVFIPSRPLEFARAAAGFWHSSLSVLHGAMLAAAIANGGEMPLPRLIERAVAANGRPLELPGRRSWRAVSAQAAREVGRMMQLTTTIGTARTTFRDKRGQRLLPVEVAGKTGSLAYRGEAGDPALPAAWPDSTYLGYSWFVGYAPVDAPEVAFAVLLANRAIWHIKAPFLAKRLIAEHLAGAGGAAHPGRAVAAR